MTRSADDAAWHEAGHVVAARLLGGDVRLATLESDLDDHHGHTEVVWRGCDSLELARRSAMTALAGPVAETLFRGEEIDDPATLATWRRDWDDAELQLRALVDAPGERDALRRRMIAELVAAFEGPLHREALARVAEALDAHGTLDDVLIDDVLG